MELTGLCGRTEICRTWGISKSLYQKLQKRPDWPRPIRLGRRVVYRVPDIVEWLEKQNTY